MQLSKIAADRYEAFVVDWQLMNVAAGLETKGIFRRCANVNVLQRVQKAFNEGK